MLLRAHRTGHLLRGPRHRYGFSDIRLKSLLQPANPAAKAAMMAIRDTARERDGSSKLDMVAHSVRNKLDDASKPLTQ